MRPSRLAAVAAGLLAAVLLPTAGVTSRSALAAGPSCEGDRAAPPEDRVQAPTLTQTFTPGGAIAGWDVRVVLDRGVPVTLVSRLVWFPRPPVTTAGVTPAGVTLATAEATVAGRAGERSWVSFRPGSVQATPPGPTDGALGIAVDLPYPDGPLAWLVCAGSYPDGEAQVSDTFLTRQAVPIAPNVARLESTGRDLQFRVR